MSDLAKTLLLLPMPQRVETYGGLVILASNFKNNIDDAFMRRFQASIHFPLPDVSHRLRLWKGAFPKAVTLAEDVHLDQIARRYELTGAHIMNVVQYACLRALERGDTRATLCAQDARRPSRAANAPSHRFRSCKGTGPVRSSIHQDDIFLRIIPQETST